MLTTAPRELVEGELRGAPAPRRRRPLSLPLLPERGRRRVRRDDAEAAAVRAGADPDAARARRDVVPPVRRPARRARGRARRPAPRSSGSPPGTPCCGTRSTTPSAPSSASLRLRRRPASSRGPRPRSRARRRRCGARPAASRRRRSRAAGRAFAHGDGVLERAGAEGAEHLAGLRRGPDAAEHARARREHGDRLVPHRRLGQRPGRPVERVLEHARDRRVVLGRRDQHGVRLRRARP